MICVLHLLFGLLLFGKTLQDECPPLPFVSLENGEITLYRRNSFRFNCNRGYYRVGPQQRRCKNGKWIPEKITKCLKAEGFCNPPTPIPHATIYGDDYAVGSTIMYTCNSGYRMMGSNNIRKCESNWAWSGLTPYCQAVDEPLQNVAVRLEKEFIQSVGSYSNDSRARSLDDQSLEKGLELVILIDRSSSVDPADFKIGIDFIKFLLKEFGVRNGKNNAVGTRAAVVTFGTEVDMVFNLNYENITDRTVADKVLDTLKGNGGGTAMVPAMLEVITEIAPHFRPEAKRALFMITDGEPNIGSDVTPQDAANQLKNILNFEIFTVGIGQDIGIDFLNSISSVPLESHVFLLEDYSQLKSMISVIKSIPPEIPKPGPKKCGFIDESLKPTEYDRWPWLAAIYISHHVPQMDFTMSLCAGALICNRWVLTAASCFYETHGRTVSFNSKEVFVVMGEHNLSEKDKSQRNYYATDVKTHPNFDPLNSMENNLALVQLNENVPLNFTFRPICLPRRDLVIPLHEDLTTNASIAGWGRSLKGEIKSGINGATTNTTLRTKVISLAEEGECLRRMKKTSLNSIFCAGVGEIDCLGNYGSPIIAQEQGTDIRRIIGVLSEKSDCSQGYSQFTELRVHLPWIDDVTNKCWSEHEI